MKTLSNIKSLPLVLLLGATSLITATRPCAASPSGAQKVVVDGSSTVFPISEAVAEEFHRANSGVGVTVGVSGTGGGFKKFIAGEVDIVNASRPIKASELELAQKNGISFIELPIAYDALSVVVNKKNTWLNSITVSELKKIWSPDSQGTVMKWSDVRPGFPDKPIQLFGPGTDSGTFDYFTEVINGKEDASRGDYTSSEDDNVIVTGVAGNEGALGYFGFAFYEANKDKLKIIPIDDEKAENGAGPQMPSAENVIKALYSPLSRPLFIYVRASSLERPEVARFISFYLANVKALSSEVGYIPLPDSLYTQVQKRVERKVAGSLFGGKPASSVAALEQLLAASNG